MKSVSSNNENVKDKRKTFLRILMIGGAIVVLCLLVCFLLVMALKSAYNSETMANYHEHHMSAADILIDKFAEYSKEAEKIGAEFAEKEFAIGGTAFYEFLDSSVDSEYVKIAYYDEFGNLYIDDSKYTYDAADDYTRNIIDVLKKADGNTSAIDNFYESESEGKQLMVAVSSLDGYIVLIEDISTFLYTRALDYQTKIGQMYITDKDMNVLGYSYNAEITDAGNNFTMSVLSYTDGRQETKRSVQTMKNDLSDGKEGYISVSVGNNTNIQISYCNLIPSDKIYFITCFNRNLTDYKIRPLLVRSMLSCLFIMSLMLAIIVYVWAISKKANLTVEKLAYEDPITHGHNINYFKEFAVKVLSASKETPFVILRFDIANFRYFNEAYGHVRADEVLVSCIKNFESVFSERELCVRITADQFLALVLNDNTSDSKIDKFRELVNADARGRGIKYPIKFKTGVYQVKKTDTDIDVMIDHANVARKTLNAKQNQYRATYSDNIVTDMRKADKMESEMQAAFANGEFHVYYQPKWDVVSNHVAGAEALVRWNKKDGNVILPEEFIPIFEQNGFVEVLDFFTLEEVCRQIRSLFDEGKTTYPISVNQSKVLLHNPDYVVNVQKILKKYNIPEGVIEIEINEDVFQDDKEAMFKVLNELKKCGIRILLDDFGSSKSSISILKGAPFDIIKIGCEFFGEAVSDKQNMWILQKVIEMINGLGLELVCEGVESSEQAVLLKNLGCRLVQGFFYSRPVPGDEYVQLFCEKYQA